VKAIHLIKSFYDVYANHVDEHAKIPDLNFFRTVEDRHGPLKALLLFYADIKRRNLHIAPFYAAFESLSDLCLTDTERYSWYRLWPVGENTVLSTVLSTEAGLAATCDCDEPRTFINIIPCSLRPLLICSEEGIELACMDRLLNISNEEIIRYARAIPEGEELDEPFELRAIRKLLAFRDKHCPGYAFDRSKPNYTPAYDHIGEHWFPRLAHELQEATVYFTEEACQLLMEQLNSGEFVL